MHRRKYLALRKSKKTRDEERTVVFSFRSVIYKEGFLFKMLKQNTWLIGDVSTISKFQFICTTTTRSFTIFLM